MGLDWPGWAGLVPWSVLNVMTVASGWWSGVSLPSDAGQQAGLLMYTAKKSGKGSVPWTGSWGAFQLVKRQSGGGLDGNKQNAKCELHSCFLPVTQFIVINSIIDMYMYRYTDIPLEWLYFEKETHEKIKKNLWMSVSERDDH